MDRRRWLLGTFAGAVVFRVLLFYSKLVDAVFETPDSFEYRWLAESILKHHVFGWEGVPKMNRTPGYPAFLALLYATIGRSQLAVTTAQVVLDSLATVMMVDIALRAKLSRVATGVVAVLSVTCLFTCCHAYQVMTETLYTFLLAASVWVLPAGGFTRLTAKENRWRLATSGLLMGAGTIVRPSFAPIVMMFGGLAVLALAWVLRKKLVSKGPLVAAVLFGATCAIVVVPWVIRNRVVFASEYAKPPEISNVTAFGYKTDVPVFRHWYTKQFQRYRRSMEEPFVMWKPYDSPTMVKYVYPGEKEDSDAAFAALSKEILASETEPVTPETLAMFQSIGDKRYAASPRLHLTAPASRVVKLWIVPRASVLWEFKHGGQIPVIQSALLTLYDCIYAIPGVIGFAFAGIWRRAKPIWLACIAVLVSQTVLYAFLHAAPLSRYMIPCFPICALGVGAFWDRARAFVAARAQSRAQRAPAAL